MNRVLLLAANRCTDPYPVYPLGMSMVAGALSRAGFAVRQASACRLDESSLAREIRLFAPQAVGVSIRNVDDVDSLTGEWFVDNVRELVLGIRELTDAPVVLGGPGFSLLPEAILQYTGADFGVCGEGERAAVEVFSELARGRTPKRLSRADHPLRGSDIAAPLADPALARFFTEQSGILPLQSKRGCFKACAYCTYPSLEGRKLRLRDPEEVAEEAVRLCRDFGARHLVFVDSVMNDPGGHYLEVAEALLRRAPGASWSGYFSPAPIGADELDLLKRSGLSAIELGTDAASDATLEGLAKGFEFAEVHRFCAACAAAEVPLAHFVIFGGPGETRATLEEGLDNLARLETSLVFAFSGVRIYPGAPIAARAVADALLDPDDDLLAPRYYFSPDVPAETIEQRVAESFRGQRLRIFPPASGQARMRFLRASGERGLIWDTLLRPPGARTARQGRNSGPGAAPRP